jgi:catechol 2,3-dioxygenase-like lactoylglutathione lyase family enzyme
LKSAIPQFTVPDVVRTAEYYRDVLGFRIAGYWSRGRVTLDADPPPVFGIVSRDAVYVYFSRGGQTHVPRATADEALDAYINVDGIDTLAAELRSRGAEILDGPEDRVYNQRELVVRDCNGFVLAFGEDRTRRAT